MSKLNFKLLNIVTLKKQNNQLKYLYMKKFLPILLIFLLNISCKKNISILNGNDKLPTIVPPASLFAYGEKRLADLVSNVDVNFNIFNLVSQYWTQTTYTDESNYNITQRSIRDNFWGLLYVRTLRNFAEAAKLIPSQDPKSVNIKNELAITEIMQVYTYSILVNTWGNVPYSQALNSDVLSPKYDDARTIYNDLLKRLDAALNNLDIASTIPNFGSSDLIFGGDINKWKAFGYSLKLKLGMILADVDPTTAKTIVEQAAPNVMQSNNNNAIFHYLSAPPNTNPIYDYFFTQGRQQDYVIAKTIVDSMKILNDPRIPLYFSTDANGGYSGGVVGKGNKYGRFSKPNDKMIDPTFAGDLLDYAEVEFLLAEAVARGMNVGGTAQSHYNNAIQASITYWGGSVTDYTNYIAQPSVNYTTAAGDYKQKIGIQKWIALYNRGYDAWTEIRRLDHPVLPTPTNAVSNFPVRYSYPAEEQTLNGANYKQAATAIGGDLVTTKLFWDIH